MSQSFQTTHRSGPPAHFREQYSAEAIKTRVAELGAEVSSWCQGVWKDSRTDVLVLPVLRGGLFFSADLVRQIACSVEIIPVQTIGYETDVSGVQKSSVTVVADSLAVKGRVVLVVDDICETGRTLETLEKKLLEEGAREVRTAVLIRRLMNRPTFVPCWVGFDYSGPEWFVGYGMDDCDHWRNLSGVHVIQRDA